jgi:hypothetical protein
MEAENRVVVRITELTNQKSEKDVPNQMRRV